MSRGYQSKKKVFVRQQEIYSGLLSEELRKKILIPDYPVLFYRLLTTDKPIAFV